MSAAPFPQLQAFLAVARLRRFSSAARELGVTRSAVSQAVRQLEEQLRVVLLARTTRSVSVTEAGRRLVEGLSCGEMAVRWMMFVDYGWQVTGHLPFGAARGYNSHEWWGETCEA